MRLTVGTFFFKVGLQFFTEMYEKQPITDQTIELWQIHQRSLRLTRSCSSVFPSQLRMTKKACSFFSTLDALPLYWLWFWYIEAWTTQTYMDWSGRRGSVWICWDSCSGTIVSGQQNGILQTCCRNVLQSWWMTVFKRIIDMFLWMLPRLGWNLIDFKDTGKYNPLDLKRWYLPHSCSFFAVLFVNLNWI